MYSDFTGDSFRSLLEVLEGLDFHGAVIGMDGGGWEDGVGHHQLLGVGLVVGVISTLLLCPPGGVQPG